MSPLAARLVLVLVLVPVLRCVSAGAGASRASRDGNRGRSTALIAFCGENLVIESAHGHSEVFPCIEVVSSRDRSTDSLGLTDGPVLVEGSSALDRGLVDTLGPVEVVGGAIGGDGAEEGGARAGIIGTEGLDDVVLDEGAGGPTVDGQVAVAVGGVVGSEGDRPVIIAQKCVNDAIGDRDKAAAVHLAAPGFHPFPPTKLPWLPDQTTLYCPAAPLV